MNKPENPIPKFQASHLHVMNLIVATIAGLISIVGGVYTLNSTVFSTPKYGSLEGIVRDEKLAKPLWLTSVEVSAPDGLVVDTVKTNGDGRYQIQSIKEGAYVIKVAAPLHINQTKNVTIERKRTSTIDFDLAPIKKELEVLPITKTSYPSELRPYIQPPQYPQPAASGGTYQTVPAPSSYPYSSQQGMAAGQTGINSQGVGVQNQPWQRSPYGGHRRHSMPSTDQGATDTSNTSQSSGNNVWMQAGAQLLQQLVEKKTDSSTQ